jgi:DNA-binding MarR family transcriptional regulator
MRAAAEGPEFKGVSGTGIGGWGEGSSEGRWSKLSARAVVDRALTATFVRVLAHLAIYADRFGVAWPSQETIADELGINRATVCRAIKRLRDLGYLDRYRKRTARGHFRNVYRLLYPAFTRP